MPALPPPIPEHRPLPPPHVAPRYDNEPPFWIYLLVSIIGFAVFFACGVYWKPHEIPQTVEVYLEPLADAVENEPPPLGDPDAGAKAETAPEPEPPQPEPEPPPEPMPEPPPVVPEFVKPEEKPPPATPPPKPATPKPTATPKAAKPSTPGPRPTAPGSGDNPDPNAKPGLRGSPNGVAGGRGGSAGDFTSRPNPSYDNLALQRRYEGQGRAKIVFENGRILDVEIVSSTGVSYLDTSSVRWIKANWRVKAGASGTVSLPIIWKLPAAH